MNTAVQLSHDDYLVAEARREWPTVQVPPHVFGAFIAARLDPSLGYEDALAALRIADLYIACACASGDVHAFGAFELRYFQEVANAIRRVGRATLSLDDLRQLLRERLFVTTRERPARINEYRGTGSLRAWLRVTAGRLALNAATRAPREMRRPSEALAELVSTGESPELALFKRKYKSEFRDAVLAALSAIDAADRTLLVQAHAEGLSIDRIGAIYGIHRATAARRLERAREAFALATRAALASRLGGASDAEVDSIIDLVRSRFDLTLGGFFRGA